ncbi:MAG: NAD-dependent succinate-semialdehyde dehydrogenase [Actinomycetota bacterium]|nr:NAD-dependent succinate-semialdehyde dehydrogenase [Actinomycetota bacterium]
MIDQLLAPDRRRLFVGGEWSPASAGGEFPVTDPSTAQPFTAVADGTVADALDAVSAAHDALAAWSATAPRERGEMLRQVFQLMIERRQQLATLITLEMGKAVGESQGEVTYAAEFLRWYAEEAVRNQGQVVTAPAGDKRILSIGQPVGVALMVTPWNFPAAMLTRKLGPALAAGCTVVVKPASDTPLTALAIGELFAEAGLPAGVVNVVPSRSSGEVVAAMLADHRVRKLSFTGSTEVGSLLLELAAKRVVNCSMELGGNAPFLVFEDADIDAAVSGAMIAKMRNGGQSCVAANRFYVHEAVADSFTAAFAAAMAKQVVGPGLDPATDLGPMINAAAQSDLTESVAAMVGDGAEAVTGGDAPDRPGYYFEPTVLRSVPAEEAVLRRELFGPVAPVVTFTSEDEAVALANDTVHGLASYLYTADLSRGLRVAGAIEAGMVGINRGLISDPAAPFGGVKESGIGREGGHEGMLEYLETKYIAADW